MVKFTSSTVQKIKQNIFMATDVVWMELTFEKLVSTPGTIEAFFDQHASIFDEIEDLLTTGPTWEFNPTTARLYASGSSELVVDPERLIDYVKEESKIKFSELDINNDVASLRIPVKLLLANVQTLPDEMINKSMYHTVHTMFGKIEI